MSSTDPRSEETLFATALEMPEAARAAYLDQTCGGDGTLRASVEALLRAHLAAEGFLPSVPFIARPVSVTATRAEEQPGDWIGRYKLMQKIGEGGCGIVYMAEQEEPIRRRVALKVIKLGMDTKAVIARFEVERQALAMMDHPNIAKVFDAGTTDSGRPFFVMELVRGISVTKYCDEQGVATEKRLELFSRICNALQHAHQKGIIHRDIKPSNVLVTLHDSVPVPKVIDFGIAKATQGKLTDHTYFTAFEQFVGTPAYMSPEQAEMSGLDIDTRSDIYSLGVLLYELLVGRPPFDPKTFLDAGLDEMRRFIREVDPPKPSTRLSTLTESERTKVARQRSTVPAQLSTELSGDLDWIVMRCIEKDRMRRYATPSELVADIDRHLSNEPVIARPPSTAYHLQKLLRRYQFAFATAGIVAVTLVVGTVVSTWAFWSEKAAHVRAVAAENEQSRQRENALAAQASETRLRRTAERNELAARHRAYAADINLVQQALAVDNLGRAQQLLNRQHPQPGQPDLRGWEWRYLWQLCRSDAQSIVCENRGNLASIAISSDGRWLAAADAEKGKLSVFDLASGEEIPVPAGDGFVWVAFSPTEPVIAVSATDGARTAKPSYRVFLWNVATRQKRLELPIRRSSGRLAFSGDGKSLLTTADELAIWRVSDGTKLSSARLPSATRTGLHAPVAVASDFTVAAHVVQDREIRVVDLSTGQTKWQKAATEDRVTALAFSPDRTLLVSGAGYYDPVIRLWDVASGRENRPARRAPDLCADLDILARRQNAGIRGGDQTIRLWDVESRQLLRTLRGHKYQVNSLALLPDRRILASGCKDGSVYLWDTVLTERKSGHVVLPKPTVAWRANDDDGSIITVDPEGTVEEWSGNGLRMRTVLTNVEACSDAFFSRDGSTLVTMSPNWLVRTWDWTWQRASGEWRGRVMWPIGLIAEGQKLFAAGGPPYFSSLDEWTVGTGGRPNSWEIPFILGDRGFAVSPDERWIVAGGLGSGFVLLDLERGTIAARSDFGSRGPAFSPDSRLLATPSPRDGKTRIWDVHAGREIGYVEGFLQGAHTAAFSPDGRRLAVTGGGIEAIKIWDMASLESLITLEAKGSPSRTRTGFSASGNLLGAYYGNQTLNIWRAPSWAEIEATERDSAHKRARGGKIPDAVQ